MFLIWWTVSDLSRLEHVSLLHYIIAWVSVEPFCGKGTARGQKWLYRQPQPKLLLGLAWLWLGLRLRFVNNCWSRKYLSLDLGSPSGEVIQVLFLERVYYWAEQCSDARRYISRVWIILRLGGGMPRFSSSVRWAHLADMGSKNFGAPWRLG